MKLYGGDMLFNPAEEQNNFNNENYLFSQNDTFSTEYSQVLAGTLENRSVVLSLKSEDENNITETHSNAANDIQELTIDPRFLTITYPLELSYFFSP